MPRLRRKFGVPWTPDSGVLVLGTPVVYPGGEVFSGAHWDKITTKHDNTIQVVTSIADAQLAHHLLRHCLDGCKVNHLLRATDCYANNNAAVARAQQAVLDGFADILGLALTNRQTAQAGLPISGGGCGLRCPEVQKPAARLVAMSTFYTRSAKDIGLPEYG